MQNTMPGKVRMIGPRCVVAPNVGRRLGSHYNEGLKTKQNKIQVFRIFLWTPKRVGVWFSLAISGRGETLLLEVLGNRRRLQRLWPWNRRSQFCHSSWRLPSHHWLGNIIIVQQLRALLSPLILCFSKSAVKKMATSLARTLLTSRLGKYP